MGYSTTLKEYYMKKYEDYNYLPSNREKNRAPKRGLFWCWGCDGNLVSEWQKCSRCGYRNGRKRRKK